jgi:hypothetical protein
MQVVHVNGRTFPVRDKQGFLKADLGGLYQWKSVWADSNRQLVQRIKRVMAEGAR